jgi:long-subunit fatty acid transport protein
MGVRARKRIATPKAWNAGTPVKRMEGSNISNKNNRLRFSGALLLGAVASNGVWAGGFAIGTQGGSGAGHAVAGGAAEADAASVVGSNPAGMTALPQGGGTVTGAVDAVRPFFKFSNAGSTGSFTLRGSSVDGDDDSGAGYSSPMDLSKRA